MPVFGNPSPDDPFHKLWKHAQDDAQKHIDESIDGALFFGETFIGNCRCVVIYVDAPWLDVLDETMDEHFGDTMPLIGEFIENYDLLEPL